MFENDSINKNIPVPLYYQLKKIILEKIHSGDLKAGDILPTEMEITDIFALSRTTVRQAITEMVSEGFLYRVKGKGTFVAKPKILQEFMSKIESFNDEMQNLNMTPSTQVLSLTLEAPPEEVAAFFNNYKDQVIVLKRLRFANSEPIVYVQSYLPLSCSAIIGKDLEKNQLYTLLSQDKKTRIHHVTRQIEAVLATKQIAKILGIEAGYPIQLTTTTGFNCFNEPIEFSIAYYPGDKNKFIVHLKAD